MVKKKIMVVEDEALTAMHLKASLLELGYQVPAIAASGAEAVRLAAAVRPDLILMDITLEGPMNGMQAAAKITAARPVPIIYLSAHSDPETMRRAKRTEPFGYLPKPCRQNTLATTLEVALFKGEADRRRRQAEQALQKSEEKYRTVADFTYDWEFWVGPAEEIIYSSPSSAKITGYPVAAFEADPTLLRSLVHPEDQALFDRHRHGARREEEEAELEFRIVRADGTIRWLAHHCRPVYSGEGKFLGTRGSNRDITARKLAELEREELLTQLQEALAKVKLLSGLLSICAGCKKIVDDQGNWLPNEEFIMAHSEAEFSHGICPDCKSKLYPEHFPPQRGEPTKS